jgi:hypothetical protein
MSNLNEIYNNLEKHLKKNEKREDCVLLEKNNEPILLDNFSKSRFRARHFRYKDNCVIPYFNKLAGLKVRFSELCKLLCNYINKNSLYLENGLIRCDAFLQSFVGKETASFIFLIGKFRLILQ